MLSFYVSFYAAITEYPNQVVFLLYKLEMEHILSTFHLCADRKQSKILKNGIKNIDEFLNNINSNMQQFKKKTKCKIATKNNHPLSKSQKKKTY